MVPKLDSRRVEGDGAGGVRMTLTGQVFTLMGDIATDEQARRRLTVLGLEPGDFQQTVVVRAPLSGKVLDLTVVPGEYRNDTNAAYVFNINAYPVGKGGDPQGFVLGMIHLF